MEARNSLVGRNLLGVYDRYGWHHLGPMWLLVLGVFRWLGGGSPVALVLGSYVLEAAAAVAIVVVANRLRPGLTGWWAALAVLGYEWSFGLERLGTVWAPYAVALPAALLVLLVADAVVSRDSWPSTFGAVICATFLSQTDISTVVLVAFLVVVTPLLRWADRVWSRTSAHDRGVAGRRGPTTSRPGRSAGNWRLRAAALVAVAVVLWLPPAVQELSTRPGNLTQVYHFVLTHPGRQSLQTSLKAEGTVFGSFPFGLGQQVAKYDARPGWLVPQRLWERPWYVAYLLVTVVAGASALVRRRRQAFALAAASGTAMVAAGLSVCLAYGPLYPYLVLWTGALVVPAWIAWWLAFAPSVATTLSHRAAALVRRATSSRRAWLVLPLASVVTAAAVSSAFAVSRVPMTSQLSSLARRSWEDVATSASAPNVKTILVEIANVDAMPEAAAIADQALRHGRRVQLDRAALHFLDPSFAPRSAAQLRIVVCCGRRDTGETPKGMRFRGRVGGQAIYTSFVGGPTRP
jgi:hypothetical protein